MHPLPFVEIKLEDLIGDGTKDLIISEDYNGLNTGVFMCRNSPWTKWFLNEVWGGTESLQHHMALHESLEHTKYPFEYEQRAFHFLFQTDIWRSRHLPLYSNPMPFEGATQTSEELWAHVHLLPQCALNSYVFHPLSLHSSPSAAYSKGDFIVHMAGHKPPNKQDLFSHFYRKSVDLRSS